MGLWFGCATVACSGPPQAQNQTAVTWSASFTGTQGAATVVFPAPNDNAEATVEQGLTVSDGGTFSPYSVDGYGRGFALQTVLGSVSASYSTPRLTGLGQGTGLPEAGLDRAVPDGGSTDFYFRVDKAGTPLVDVIFEYTVQRNCGGGCGGKRSWTYSGPVGLALQPITLKYTEEKTP